MASLKRTFGGLGICHWSLLPIPRSQLLCVLCASVVRKIMSNIIQPSHLPTADPSFAARCIRVCQNRTCRKQGSVEVLAAFAALPVAGVVVTASGCLGQCGNGVMVLVLPEMVWYSAVQPSEVPLVVKQHLLCGQRVRDMLYYRFHPQG
jgi:(2Fe-2S) ferredoxin